MRVGKQPCLTWREVGLVKYQKFRYGLRIYLSQDRAYRGHLRVRVARRRIDHVHQEVRAGDHFKG